MFYTFSFQPCSSCGNHQQAEGGPQLEAQPEAQREAERMQANREELVERIARAVPEDVTVQPLKGLSLSLCDECQKGCSVLKNPREVDNPGTMHVPSSSFRRQF